MESERDDIGTARDPHSVTMDHVESMAPLSISTVGDGLSLQFERASLHPSDNEIAVPLSPQYKSFKKLEVVTSRRINLMAKVYNLLSLFALILSAVVVIVARFRFSETFRDIPIVLNSIPMRVISVTVYTFPKYFTIIDSTLSFVVFAYTVLLFVVYVFILVREGRKSILNEQVWVIMLLIAGLVYLNPYEGSIRLQRDVMGIVTPKSEDGFSYVDILTSLRYMSFIVIYWLYLWFGAHSYRFLSRRVSIRDWRFYAVKVTVLVTYVAVKLLFLFVFRIVCSEMPFATFLSFLVLYCTVGIWPTFGILAVAVVTTLELVIIAMIGMDMRRTFAELGQSEYTKHRTKILGYRFFLHQQLGFNIVYATTYAFLLFGLPIGVQVLQFFLFYDDMPGRGSYFTVQYAPFGLHLCILAFITTEAYTNLPANVNVWQALFPYRQRQAPHRPPPLQPVVYRNREPPSLPGDLMYIPPNCFVMQTSIELFNLSWYVYYHGTPKERTLNLDMESLGLKIRDCLYDASSDTKAIVAETRDRIIFAFKGTSSGQNLRTDLRVHHRSLSSVIDSAQRSPTHAGRRLLAHFQAKKEFRGARVHAGFADAYARIKDSVIGATAALMREKQRPICFTGHSLGGALATLSSLDVQLTLGVDARNVAVSSFGSPRVGNDAFQELYDEAIPTHWRFVAGGDLISRLPKVGYRHVGKKVVLTATGELFIDPSALEIVLWHSQKASIVHHRKSCYLLALRAWCDSRGDYRPNLWPFPVSPSDSKKFDSTFRRPDSQRKGTLASGALPRPHGMRWGTSTATDTGVVVEDRAARMQLYADAIDALDGGGGASMSRDISETAIELWRRVGLAALTKLRNTNTDDSNGSSSGTQPATSKHEQSL